MTQVNRVAVIGLGAMGLPMASRLHGEFDVTGFDPAAQRLELARAASLGAAATPASAAADADVVVLAVRDRAQAETALFGSDGAAAAMRAGAVVVLTSTIGPDAAIAIAEPLRERGLLVVDAPISGGPVRAGNGELLVVVGADEEALALAKPVLDRLASSLILVGPRIGDGQLLKVINQLLAGVHIAAAAEAVALARGVGLDPATVINALTGGAAHSFMLADRGPRMVEVYEHEPEVKSRVDIFVKDMGIVADVARQAHVATPLAIAAQDLYRQADEAGLGAQDDSSVVTILSPRGGNNPH
jgi:3-hydroxyisobutyrate dehydrogenase